MFPSWRWLAVCSLPLIVALSACDGAASGADGSTDAAMSDSGHDAGVSDSGSADAGPGDAGLGDAGLGDAGLGDAGLGDAGLGDAGLSDAGLSDAGLSDAGLSDAGLGDSGVFDAGGVDAGAADAGSVDAGAPDAGPCVLSAVSWATSSAQEGSSVGITVAAQGACAGGSAQLVVRDDYGTRASVQPPAIALSAGGGASAWVATWYRRVGAEAQYTVEATLGLGRPVLHSGLLTVSRSPTRGVCDDGLDNDSDGLVDMQDPGCAASTGTSEGAEGRSHHFTFTFANDGLLQSLFWSPDGGLALDGGPGLEVVQDEFGHHGPAYVQQWAHSVSTNDGWTVKLVSDGGLITEHTAGIARTKVSQTADVVVTRELGTALDVSDTYRFAGDTVYVTVDVHNLLASDVELTDFSLYFGALLLSDASLHELSAGNGGDIFNWSANPPAGTSGHTLGTYPNDIVTFSPVGALWDSRFTVGEQLLTPVEQPDTIELSSVIHFQFLDTLRTRLLVPLAAGQTRRFVFAFGFAAGGDWQRALTPYAQFFHRYYGATPSYCPPGPMTTLVGSNTCYTQPPQYNNNLCLTYDAGYPDQRWLPGSSLGLNWYDRIVPTLPALQFEQVGVWQTALNSRYLNTSGVDVEFNPNIDLLDPNLDIAQDSSKIDAVTRQWGDAGVGLFWFARPCYEISGAAIATAPDGGVIISKGVPTNLDLRDPAARDRQYARMQFFFRHGVSGFYLDAMGCAGDHQFLQYARREARAELGRDVFMVKEGSVDRDALEAAQIPILFPGPRADPQTVQLNALLFWLTPQATFYGGQIDDQLTTSETDAVIALGYQPVDGCPSCTAGSSAQRTAWQGWSCTAYQSRVARQQSGCQPLVKPTYCP